MRAVPPSQGLYDPAHEHDACGVAMVATLTGHASHQIIEQAVTALRNLDHRGASGADAGSGDGAGIMTQIPHALLRDECAFALPAPGRYAVGTAFLPTDHEAAEKTRRQIADLVDEEGLRILGWREVPTRPEVIGSAARDCMPALAQLFITSASTSLEQAQQALERAAFCLRKRVEHETDAYFPSLSTHTLVYKGMLTTSQLADFYPDLPDDRFASAMAIVHSRFSTNTFPSWPLAHPYRLVAHNGEINTVRGNRNWMRAREALLASDRLPGDLRRLYPICVPGGSDSATFDEVLELLHLAGRSLPHAMLMMIPEAWENNVELTPGRRAFYEFHSTLMEPWDGPACVVFSNGRQVGAVLDRNGLRPARYWLTEDGLVVLASEVGVLDLPPESIVAKGRLQPGRMFLVDLDQGRIVGDDEVKDSLAAELPYDEWLHAGLIRLPQLPERQHVVHSHVSVTRRQQIFGYTEEDLRILLTPMARDGAEPTGSMGTDTPIAVLSARPRLLFDYFSQLFAQVTNPPLDAIREELVTSLAGTIGPEANLLEPGPTSCRQVVLPFPVIDNDELAKIVHINRDGDLRGYATHVLRCLYPVAGGGAALERRLAELYAEVTRAIDDGARIIVLSDRNATPDLAPVPSLLVTSGVHHHLVRERLRSRVGLVVEAGDVREVHHVALLIGYGAAAVNPYLAMETVEDLARRRGYLDEVSPEQAVTNLVTALGKGVLKVMSKVGVSTIASYTGAQIFEAVGLGDELVERYFTGTASRLGGVGIDVLAAEVAARHRQAHSIEVTGQPHRVLDVGGEYQWRRGGEPHLFDPESVFRLQHATRSGRFDIFRQYTARVDEQSQRLMTIRGLMSFSTAREPVPLEEVEPASEIVKRFSTGAMSYGSISQEAHETLAVAMNLLGARSNTGEGGEDPDRLHDPARRSAIKQVASGRFGVTSDYLTSADDIQIKMAQGAKPGEGGQLPGTKVYPWIAQTRGSTPGVGLISPPPHHDIYSIEDLAQLIHDLKNANPQARIHVKLVSEAGVGTVAAGVSKAHADVVLISGHDGGTGAAPLTSLKHAGGPWEIGLAETQQTLLLNGLRDRIVVQCDGQLKTGRDVMVAALLGAEEFGFATAPLVVVGCILMRVCHLDTCPVGIATQNPDLRSRYTGRAEHVVRFFQYVAEEVRELLARLGFRSLQEAVGHAELLETRGATEHWKASGLDLEPLLHVPHLRPGTARHHTMSQQHGLEHALDNELVEACAPALHHGEPVRLARPIRNVNRTVGTMLGHRVTKRRPQGLPDGTIDVTFTGSAGQSFGAFLPRGVTLRVHGDANDYVAKGLSGGRVVVRPDPRARFAAEQQVVAGNVIGYGATSGSAFVRGIVGERFAVRNSGASLVVEGVGDHACEYMTGGEVVILGPVGRNVAAGMSGGAAFVLDLLPARVNPGLVDLAPVEPATGERLHALIEEHAAETGSVVAAELLGDWPAARRRFTEIVPRNYRRVLEAKRRAEDDGLDEHDTVMAMMGAGHG
jgi:glutamate synthase (NADPH) large chain